MAQAQAQALIQNQAIPRDASWLFESLHDETEKIKCRVNIPDSLIFRRDNTTSKLALSVWLYTSSKTGNVSKRTTLDTASLKKWRDKLLTGIPPGTPVAQVFGFDGVGQGVPPQGLDNLLSDLDSGNLEGIAMLQARVRLGARPGGHFEVEYTLDNTPAGTKPILRPRLASTDTSSTGSNAAAVAALRSAREELLAAVKRMIVTVEGVRKVRVLSGVFEFVADSGNNVHCVGAYGVRTSLAEGEMSPEIVAAAELEIMQLASALMQQQQAAAAVTASILAEQILATGGTEAAAVILQEMGAPLPPHLVNTINNENNSNTGTIPESSSSSAPESNIGSSSTAIPTETILNTTNPLNTSLTDNKSTTITSPNKLDTSTSFDMLADMVNTVTAVDTSPMKNTSPNKTQPVPENTDTTEQQLHVEEKDTNEASSTSTKGKTNNKAPSGKAPPKPFTTSTSTAKTTGNTKTTTLVGKNLNSTISPYELPVAPQQHNKVNLRSTEGNNSAFTVTHNTTSTTSSSLPNNITHDNSSSSAGLSETHPTLPDIETVYIDTEKADAVRTEGAGTINTFVGTPLPQMLTGTSTVPGNANNIVTPLESNELFQKVPFPNSTNPSAPPTDTTTTAPVPASTTQMAQPPLQPYMGITIGADGQTYTVPLASPFIMQTVGPNANPLQTPDNTSIPVPFMDPTQYAVLQQQQYNLMVQQQQQQQLQQQQQQEQQNTLPTSTKGIRQTGSARPRGRAQDVSHERDRNRSPVSRSPSPEGIRGRATNRSLSNGRGTSATGTRSNSNHPPNNGGFSDYESAIEETGDNNQRATSRGRASNRAGVRNNNQRDSSNQNNTSPNRTNGTSNNNNRSSLSPASPFAARLTTANNDQDDAGIQLGPDDRENVKKLKARVIKLRNRLKTELAEKSTLKDELENTKRALAEKPLISQAALVAASALAGEHSKETVNIAALRSAGRFDYQEEKISDDADKGALLEVIRRLHHKWRDAIELASQVANAVSREREDVVRRLQEAHRQELVDMKAAFEAMEERVLITNARLDSTSQELAASARREQVSNVRADRLAQEAKRLSTELQNALVQINNNANRPSTANPFMNPSGGMMMIGPNGVPITIPNPNANNSNNNNAPQSSTQTGRRAPSPRNSITGGLNTNSERRTTGIARNIGAQIISGGLTPVNPVEDLFNDTNINNSASTSNAPNPQQAANTAQVRQLQLELDAIKESLANEISARQELSAANSKLIDDFRSERRRLKAQISQLEDAERARVGMAMSNNRTDNDANINNNALTDMSAGGVSRPGSATSASLGTLMQKVRETENLQATVAQLRSELAEAQTSLQASLAARLDATSKLDALIPVRSALEAELAALRSEVASLRKNGASTSTRLFGAGGGARIISVNDSSNNVSPRPSRSSTPALDENGNPVTMSPNGTSTAAVSMLDDATVAIIASERAASTRAAAEATMVKGELRVLREQAERMRQELHKSQEQLNTLRATKAAEIESIRSSERAERDAAIKELSLANEAGVRSALETARQEMNSRFEGRITSLQSEVMKISQQLQDSLEEAAKLRAAAAAANERASAAEAEKAIPPPPVNPQDDPVLLRSALGAAHATVAALRNELGNTRQNAERQAAEAAQQYAARLAQLQAAQANALAQAVREAETASAVRLQSAVAEVSTTMADDIRRLQEASREAVERSNMSAEDNRIHLLAAADARLQAVLGQLEGEVQTRLQGAIVDAVNAARAEWEAATDAAIAVMKDGEARSASEMATSMAAAARKEVESTLLPQIRSLEDTLERERAATNMIRGELAAKEMALQAVVADVRQQAAEMQLAQAAAIANAERAARDEAAKNLNNRLAETKAEAARTLKAETEKWATKLQAIEAEARSTLESRLSAQERTLKESHMAALQAAEAAQRSAVDKAVREALDTVQQLGDENSRRLREMQAAAATEKADLVARHATELGRVQARLDELVMANTSNETLLAHEKQTHSEELANLQTSHAQQIAELENLINGLRQEQENTAVRVQTTFEALKTAAETEILAVRQQAATDVQATLAAAEAEAVRAVEAAVARAREQWQIELNRAVQTAADSARSQFNEELGRLAATADNQVAGQAEMFRQMEVQWNESMRTMQEAQKREVDRLSNLLNEAHVQADKDRAALTAKLAETQRDAEKRIQAAVSKAENDAANERKELETKLNTMKESAVKAAVDKANQEANARLEAEREKFRKTSSSTADSLMQETNKLIEGMRAEANRDREMALATLRNTHVAEMERMMAQVYESQAALAAERDRAVAAADSARNAAVAEATAQIANLKEALVAAEARGEAIRNEVRIATEQAQAALLSETEARLKEIEEAWSSRAVSLQADNEQAAAIIAGLLREADEAARRTDDLQLSLKKAHETHAKELSEKTTMYEEKLAALIGTDGRSVKDLEVAIREIEQRTSKQFEEAKANWEGERLRMEMAFAAEREALTSIAAQSEGAALAAVEDIRQRFLTAQESEVARLRTTYENDMETLRRNHQEELDRLRSSYAEEQNKLIMDMTKEFESRAAASVNRVREEAQTAAAERVAELEADVARELGQATKAATASNAAVLQNLKDTHAKEIEALKAEALKQAAGAAEELANAQLAANNAIEAVRAQYQAEIQTLQETMVPYSVLGELRDKMEVEALAALQSAVSEAVTSSRQEAEALQEVLRQRIAEQEMDRKQLSAQLDVIQEAVGTQMEQAASAVRAADERAERALMYAEDVAVKLQAKYSAEAMSAQIVAATQAAEGWLSQQVAAAQQEMETALRTRSEEMQQAAAQNAAAFAAAREELLHEKSTLETALQNSAIAANEAITARDVRLADLEAILEKTQSDLLYARTTAMEELRMQMREMFESEKAASESKSREAVAQAVAEAVAAGNAMKDAEMEKLRKEYTARFTEFEQEAANMHTALKAALEARHKAEMEVAFKEALVDRDVSVEKVMRDKEQALLDAQRITAIMLDDARAEHEVAIARLRASHEEEKQALAERAAADITSALEAAKNEMQALLAAADAAWQQRATSLLQEQGEAHSKLVGELQAAAQQHMETVSARYETKLMETEEARIQLLRAHEAALEFAISKARAEDEADKIAALGAFNAEWVAKLEAKVAELMAEREAELTAVRAEYQSQIENVVATLEAQRQSALEAFQAEAEAERARLIAEKERAVAEAIERERAIAARILAEAMQRAREEKEQALAEQAAKLAEERAKAIDAVRQQATEEQEEAMDALRVESEKLLGSIEGAMTKLRDERDLAQEDTIQAQEELKKEKAETKRLKGIVAAQKRSGLLANLRAYLLAGRYISVLNRVKHDAENRRIQDLQALNTEWADKYGHLEQVLDEQKGKFRVLLRVRANMQETLTSFKREMLMQHKVKSTTLAQELASLSEAKAEAGKAASSLGGQVSEVEGTIRAIEKEMQELSKQSVIEKDGTVNVALTRKKKRLDRDMDTALVKISDRRAALSEVERKMQDLEDARTRKEEALKQVEASLVATLVQQQRKLMQLLANVPLPPEDLELDSVAAGGDGGVARNYYEEPNFDTMNNNTSFMDGTMMDLPSPRRDGSLSPRDAPSSPRGNMMFNNDGNNISNAQLNMSNASSTGPNYQPPPSQSSVRFAIPSGNNNPPENNNNSFNNQSLNESGIFQDQSMNNTSGLTVFNNNPNNSSNPNAMVPLNVNNPSRNPTVLGPASRARAVLAKASSMNPGNNPLARNGAAVLNNTANPGANPNGQPSNGPAAVFWGARQG